MTAPDRAGDLCTCLRCQDEREAAPRSNDAAYPRLEAFMFRGPTTPGWSYACAVCGNKRCPHHEDHRFVCTRSNEPGQIGQLIEARDAALADLGALDADLIVMAPDASAVTDEAVEAFARAYTGEDEWQLAYDNSAAAKADMRTGLTAALPHLTAAKDAEIAQINKTWDAEVADRDAKLATRDAEIERLRKALTDICGALGVNPTIPSHAGYNLLGAHADLKLRRADPVICSTIERVVGQLAKVEEIIKRAALGDAT